MHLLYTILLVEPVHELLVAWRTLVVTTDTQDQSAAQGLWTGALSVFSITDMLNK